MRKTLRAIPLRTLVKINDGTYPTVAELKNGISLDDLPTEKIKLLLEEAVIGILGTIYRVLDNNFECSAVCTPSYFALGSDDITTTAPPSRGCIGPFQEYIDHNFGKWGWSLTIAAVILYTLLGFTCCLNKPDLFGPVGDKPAPKLTSEPTSENTNSKE
jgi:hypothetical protein